MDEKLVEYIDWSDRGIEKHEAGQSVSKYAQLSFFLEGETAELADLIICLRRNTKAKKEFFVHLDAREIYEYLKEHFEE